MPTTHYGSQHRPPAGAQAAYSEQDQAGVPQESEAAGVGHHRMGEEWVCQAAAIGWVAWSQAH